MPKVKGKRYPYTPEGMKAAAEAKGSMKQRKRRKAKKGK